jgi:osmotically-inducible protein OsmY
MKSDMQFKQSSRRLVSALSLLFAVAACGANEADLKKAVDDAAKNIPGTSISVNDGVVTIAGQFADSAQKAKAEATLKAVEGVKSVVDNASIAPPPVVLSADDSLRMKVADALHTYGTVSSQVQDGVVTLGGTMTQADAAKISEALSGVHAKKIENKATIKN